VPGKLYNATFGRLFSACYDSFLKGTEEAGLSDKRAALVAQAQGETIEIGAGTGLNLEHYPDGVTRLVLTDPDPHMTKRLRKKVAASSREAEIIEAGGEKLPFPDDSFDTAVATLVLCTAPDAVGALSEVKRVLKPGGRFLFLEHVRSHDPGTAKWQDRLELPWTYLADGCHPNRDTLAAIKASGMTVEGVEDDKLPKAPPVVRPLIIGSARAS
jgi:ubiquinone/menaquinone biosynthesis C-methylase UbiE